MWCVPHPTKEGHTLVLLDTEGLGDVEKGDEKHDTWIFCLAVLLSSTLVYNSLGTIDNMALEKLHYVTELTENIRVKAEVSRDEDQSADFMRVFPSFVWAVRDFTLELKKGDDQITSDEYLESALKLKTGSSAQTERYNLPRQCLRHFFAVRKCFVFPRPASTKNMRRMEELEENDLDSEFLEQAKNFCRYIYDNAEPKVVSGGRAITGTALGNLAEVYIEAIRSGKVPCLENAVVSLAKIQNVRAVEQALESYMTEMLSMAQLPMDPEDLSNIHTVAEKKATEVFIAMSFNDNDQIYQQELMARNTGSARKPIKHSVSFGSSWKAGADSREAGTAGSAQKSISHSASFGGSWKTVAGSWKTVAGSRMASFLAGPLRGSSLGRLGPGIRLEPWGMPTGVTGGRSWWLVSWPGHPCL
ncbi:Guanylate-binding protein 1 [Anabarilius grahami]|uniref:Guanylate-binding protein 1 n=1 Tax=Anabarilius grahami TaxID=495550 RepID=A0A3N0XTD2_ANAGA|nr:Guanylate-binding protein 1 [Anabarilius grahami]